VTLTELEIPSHTHTNTVSTAGAHTHTATTESAGSHSHTSNATGGQGNYGLALANGSNTVEDTDNSSGELNVWTVPGALTINNSGDHTHTLTTGSSGNHNHTVTINNTGGGQAHENMPPYVVVNYIIKVKSRLEYNL
jgi:microcystin-dependent protein